MISLVFLRVLPPTFHLVLPDLHHRRGLYFELYLEPSVIDAADFLLLSYINVLYNWGMVLIFTICPLAWCTAIANLPMAQLLCTSLAALVLYLLGLPFSIAHMLWGPHAIKPCLT
jgi:hypothetical protein